MEKMPLISVGIPTYNRPVGLKRVIACVLSQTYTNLEIIVSDNCSTNPDVEELLNSVGKEDPRIKVFKQPKNTGLAHNFQFVLSQASGKYFMWISDDDLIECNFIMELSTILEQFPDVHLAIPELTLYNASHEKVEIRGQYSSLEHESSKQRVFDYFRQSMKINYFYGLYRREVAQQFEFIPTMFGADILFSVCMAFSGKVLLSPRTSYTYFMGGNSFDPERLAKVLELPAWKAPLWGFNDAIQTVRYIMHHAASRNLSLQSKIIFPIRVFFMMLKKTQAFRSFAVISKRKFLKLILNRPVLKANTI